MITLHRCLLIAGKDCDNITRQRLLTISAARCRAPVRIHAITAREYLLPDLRQHALAIGESRKSTAPAKLPITLIRAFPRPPEALRAPDVSIDSLPVPTIRGLSNVTLPLSLCALHSLLALRAGIHSSIWSSIGLGCAQVDLSLSESALIAPNLMLGALLNVSEREL